MVVFLYIHTVYICIYSHQEVKNQGFGCLMDEESGPERFLSAKLSLNYN